MINPKAKLPIGVFDSGVGGISVLAEIIKMLPDEEFVYFADTLNSPYGTKPENVIRSLAINAAGILSNMGIKALVVACNTATSAAINEIRGMHTFQVIGMEPAVKPAVGLGLKGKILVMATPITLKGKKFRVQAVLPPKGQVSFLNFDEIVLIPYSTAQTYLLGIDHYHEIILKASSPEAVE